MNKEETLEQRDIIKPYINSEEGFENFTENTDFISDLNKYHSANLVDIILDVETILKSILIMSLWKMVDVKSTLEIIDSKLSQR
jgi:acyl carrier protein